MLLTQFMALLVIAYLLGALSFALIAAQLFKFPDPRTAGSKNPGATNVLRLGGKGAAFFVIVGDIAKGIIPVVIAKILHMPLFLQGFIALAAVLGHIFPVYYSFKGGKGVATTLGILIALNIPLGLAASITWLLMAWTFRYSSLASIVMILSVPAYAFLLQLKPLLPALFFMVAIILICHRGNIKRLMLGEESKIGQK